MKKDSIRDFVSAWVQYDGNKNVGSLNLVWPRRFKEAGYYGVPLHNTSNNWPEIHRWCSDQFGVTHYGWTGSIWWFESERDAAIFTLRWA